jgi:hypothetical protein
VGLSTGVGVTYFSHKLDGFGVIQKPGAAPMIFSSSQVTSGYSNWFNTVTPVTNTPAAGDFLIDSDTAHLGFKSKGLNVPLKATLHVEIDRYRIGGGYSMEYVHIGDFRPISYQKDIGSFAPAQSSIFMKKYFVMLGGMLYHYDNYTLVLDVNVGGYKLGNSFNSNLIRKGIYFNTGVTAERQLSEYFRLFVRPSFEFKNFKLAIPESTGSLTHRLNAFYVNVGASYRLPDLRRCPIKNCKAQINHAHGNREYRSRVHPIYKKQNPHYGENYPTLIKYKGANKRKLNPY